MNVGRKRMPKVFSIGPVGLHAINRGIRRALSLSETLTQTLRHSRSFLCAHQPLSLLSTISGDSGDDMRFWRSSSRCLSTSVSSFASALNSSTDRPRDRASSLKTSPPFMDLPPLDSEILATSVDVPLPGGPLIVTFSKVLISTRFYIRRI